MPAPQSDLLQGTLDALILKSVALQELHGMGISRRISQMTSGAFDVKAGSLFPALHGMDSLTKAGRKQLQTETARWERISLAMATALGTS